MSDKFLTQLEELAQSWIEGHGETDIPEDKKESETAKIAAYKEAGETLAALIKEFEK